MAESHLLIRSSVTHHANCLNREKNSERLRNLVIQAGLTNLLDVDAVRMLQDLDLLPSDGPKNPNSETRTWEGMALHEWRGNG